MDPLLFVFHVCHAHLAVPCSLVVTYLDRADLLALLYVMFSCILSQSLMVSWIRCGIILHQFLIFAFSLTCCFFLFVGYFGYFF